MTPGSVIIFLNGERGFLNAGIRFAQGCALKDLYAKRLGSDNAGDLADAYKAYTHAAVVIDAETFGEMYYPKARFRKFSELPSGTRYLVRQLKGGLTREEQMKIVTACQIDVKNEEPYATTELLAYWFRWVGPKIWLRRKFADVFTSKTHDVCSGRVVHWYHAAGRLLQESPNAWYPARLASDMDLFETMNITEFP